MTGSVLTVGVSDWQCPSPVAGLVTWQLSCTLLLTGQAAGVGQEKVYSQSSTALMNMGLEFYERRTECCQQGTISVKHQLTSSGSFSAPPHGIFVNVFMD